MSKKKQKKDPDPSLRAVHKTRTEMDDGRYLIYFTFDKGRSSCGEPHRGKSSQPKASVHEV